MVPCRTPHFYEETLKQAFMDAFNSLIENKAEILDGYGNIIKALTDTSAFDAESKALQEECNVVIELMRKCVEENAQNAIDQSDYQSRYSAMLGQYETAKKKLAAVDGELQERKVKRENISRFLCVFKKSDNLLAGFDEDLWHATVDRVIVKNEHEITFRFKDGTKLPWII